MKNYILLFATIPFLLFACSSDDHDSTKPTAWPEDPANKGKSGIDRSYEVGMKLDDTSIKLVWADEFNDEALNMDFWSYEKGYVRNKEVQYYTQNRKENCKLENGMLVLTGRKETTPFEGATYTSASIITNKKKSWQYGRFEVRAKVPGGTTGIWPAFWAKGDSQNTGDSWPKCGEIDIMEYAVKKPNEMIQNVIWGESAPAKSKTAFVKSDQKYSDDFHIYTLNWSSTQITFAIDNKVTHVVNMSEITGHNPFYQAFSLLLNLALGTPDGNSLGGKFDEANLPVQFLVDYVRVYQTEVK